MRLPSGGELYMVRRNGLGLFRLTYGNGDSKHPAWSFGSGLVAYSYQQDEQNSGIYLVKEDGSGKKRLLSGRAINPIWSADGGMLLFVRQQARYLFAVALYDLEKNCEKQLAELKSTSFLQPSFSPDGKNIVYWGTAPDDPGRCPAVQDIYVCECETGIIRQLTDSGSFCCAAEFSPDGKRLAYMRRTRDFHFRLCMISLREGDETTVTDELYYFTPPRWRVSWSPDGQEVAYLQDGEIHLLHIASGKKHRVTRPLDEESRQSLAATKDKKLVFITNTPGGIKDMMAPDMKITLADRVPNAGQPFWSPDGHQVAYVRDETVYLTKRGQGGGQRVSRGKVMDDHLAWSADGEKLIYVGEREY